jgi:CelD/BcsL family acetyltransferase involved in cellulose biosynthesis
MTTVSMRSIRAEEFLAAVIRAPAAGVGVGPSRSAGLAVCRPDDPGWLRLIQDDPAATAFHHPAWSRVMTETYGFRSFVLAQQGADGQLVAGLPVVETQKPFGQRRLVSLPFTDHCPPLVGPAEDSIGFAEALGSWRATGGRAALEIRAEVHPSVGAHLQTVGTRHLVDLEPDAEAVFRRLHRNRIQKRVRRAREFGVEVSLSRSRADLATFYRLHCQTRRRLGVPVQPMRFIESIWKEMIEPGLGFIVLARIGPKPIATALFLAWNRHLIYKYGASDQANWKLGANFLVHWTAMEWGCANGCRLYDFGRTDKDQDGLREFKSAWGSTELPLVYSHLGTSPPAFGHGLASTALAHVIKRSPTLVCRALGELLYRYTA